MIENKLWTDLGGRLEGVGNVVVTVTMHDGEIKTYLGIVAGETATGGLVIRRNVRAGGTPGGDDEEVITSDYVQIAAGRWVSFETDGASWDPVVVAESIKARAFMAEQTKRQMEAARVQGAGLQLPPQ